MPEIIEKVNHNTYLMRAGHETFTVIYALNGQSINILGSSHHLMVTSEMIEHAISNYN